LIFIILSHRSILFDLLKHYR